MVVEGHRADPRRTAICILGAHFDLTAARVDFNPFAIFNAKLLRILRAEFEAFVAVIDYLSTQPFLQLRNRFCKFSQTGC